VLSNIQGCCSRAWAAEFHFATRALLQVIFADSPQLPPAASPDSSHRTSPDIHCKHSDPPAFSMPGTRRFGNLESRSCHCIQADPSFSRPVYFSPSLPAREALSLACSLHNWICSLSSMRLFHPPLPAPPVAAAPARVAAKDP